VFEVSEIQEKTGIYPNNTYDAIQKLEQSGYIQKVTPTRQYYTAYRYSATGTGMALLRKFYKELKAI
jgi:DNA-binding IclR family transcriptional regulator